MKCPNCGNEILEGQFFCTVCGARVEQPAQPAPQPQVQPVVAQPEQQVQVQPVAAQPEQQVQVQPVQAQPQVQPQVQPVVAQPQVAPQVQQPMAQPQPQVQAQPAFNPYAESNNVAPKKKKHIWPIVLAVFLILITGAGVAAYMNKDLVVNAWKKNFSSPKDYYLWVEKKNADESSDKIAKAYNEKMQFVNSDNKHVDFNLGLEMSNTLFEVMGLDEDEINQISFLKKTQIKSSVDQKGDLNASVTKFLIGDQEIISMDGITDGENQMYIAVKDMSPKFLKFNLEDLTGASMTSISSQEYVQKFADCAPDAETTKRLYKRYMEVLYQNYNNIALEKSTILQVSNVAQKCAQIDVTLTKEDMFTIVDAMFDTMANDADLQKIYEDYMQIMKEQYEDRIRSYNPDYVYEIPSYADAIAEARKGYEESKERADMEDGYLICMSVYVDNKGNIIGREWNTSRNGINEYIHCLSARENGQRAFDISILADSKCVAFLGSGTETNGKFNGHFTMEFEGIQQFDVEAKDFEIDALQVGRLNGTFVMKPTDKLKNLAANSEYAEMLNSAKITLTSYMSGSENRMSFDIDTKDEKFLGLSMEQFLSKAKEIVLPAAEDIIEVKEVDSVAFAQYVKDLDFTKLNENLRAIGMPEEMMEDLIDSEEELKEDAAGFVENEN